MSFVSYAQNFEDVMLWRALKHVEQGCYVDVGANDPNVDSVTKAFYERGWHGINVEPLASHYQDLLADRSRDINLCCAAGETSGEIEVFESDVRGWATADQSVVDKLVQEGHKGIHHRVPLRTLFDIFQEYVVGEIHFLKIDVEGFEQQVIRGADFQKFRPWILVVEATSPNSTVEVHEKWEDLLFAADYQFAYADGLNRFYVAVEHSELLPSLLYPPNVFDEFATVAQVMEEAKAQLAEERSQRVESELVESRAHVVQVETTLAESRVHASQIESALAESRAHAVQVETTLAESREHSQWLGNEWNAAKAKVEELNQISHHWWTVADGLDRDLKSICGSRSWRYTKPLRVFGQMLRRWRAVVFSLPGAMKQGSKSLIKPVLARGVRFVMVRPALKAQALSRLRKYPAIEARLRRFAAARGLTTGFCLNPTPSSNISSPSDPGDLAHLTPRARKIYVGIKVAIDQCRKENG